MSTASESNSMPIDRSPFVRSVLPVETRSMMASASPRRGEISTEPATVTISALTPRSASDFAAMRGCDVATRRPSRSSMRWAVSSFETAACSEQVP